MATKKKQTLPAPEPPQPAPLALPRFSGRQRLLIYPLSLLVPGAGLALGALYAAQEDREARRFGWTCVALALLGGLLRARQGQPLRGWETGESLLQPFY